MIQASERCKEGGTNVICKSNRTTSREHREGVLSDVYSHGRRHYCHYAQTCIHKTWPEVPPVQVGAGCGLCYAAAKSRLTKALCARRMIISPSVIATPPGAHRSINTNLPSDARRSRCFVQCFIAMRFSRSARPLNAQPFPSISFPISLASATFLATTPRTTWRTRSVTVLQSRTAHPSDASITSNLNSRCCGFPLPLPGN